MMITFLTGERADCLLVIPKEPAVVEQTAAEEVQVYLERALGVKLPIVTEEKAEGSCIYIGRTNYAERTNTVGKSKEKFTL